MALHLTRPAIDIPDREALGMPSHFEAARGAYVLRALIARRPRRRHGLRAGHDVTTANLVKVLPRLDERGHQREDRGGISPQLFAMQDEDYRERDRARGGPLGRHGRHQPGLQD